jgi:hypothetical protein
LVFFLDQYSRSQIPCRSFFLVDGVFPMHRMFIHINGTRSGFAPPHVALFLCAGCIPIPDSMVIQIKGKNL